MKKNTRENLLLPRCDRAWRLSAVPLRCSASPMSNALWPRHAQPRLLSSFHARTSDQTVGSGACCVLALLIFMRVVRVSKSLSHSALLDLNHTHCCSLFPSGVYSCTVLSSRAHTGSPWLASFFLRVSLLFLLTTWQFPATACPLRAAAHCHSQCALVHTCCN